MTYVDTPDTSGAAAQTAPDQDESAGTVSSGGTTVGKYYKIDVPDYTGAGGAGATMPESYLRLGAVNPDTDGGEDSANLVAQNDMSVHAAGGVRDHTDGNRIVTTRGDKIEVVGGTYRMLVNVGADPTSPPPADPPWTTPTGGATDEETDDPSYYYIQHLFADEYYEVIATTAFPTGTYAETIAGSATVTAGDVYEYSNGVDTTEIMAASNNLVEKTYAGNAILEQSTTVHATLSAWETINYGPSSTTGPYPVLSAGALYDYMFAQDFTEVMRATDLLIDKIYGGRLVEAVSTTHLNDYTYEADPGTLVTGDLKSYMFGNNVREVLRADSAVTELFEAVAGDLTDTMQAWNGKITEHYSADDISFTYSADESFEETTTADTKTSTTYLKLGSGEVTLCPTLSGVTTSVLDLTLGMVGLKGDMDLSLLSLDLSAAVLHIDFFLGLSSELLKKLDKGVYLMRDKVGLTYKSTYEQIDLGIGPPL